MYADAIAARHQPASTAAATEELPLPHDLDGASAFCVLQALILIELRVAKLLLAV